MTTIIEMVFLVALGGAAAGLPAAALLRGISRERDAARVDLEACRSEIAASKERECTLASKLSVSEREAASVQAELRAARKASEEKLRLLERAAANVDDRLKAAMSDAVAVGSDRLLSLAAERSAREREEDGHRRAHDRTSLSGLVAPLGDGLERLEARLGALECQRLEGQAALRAQMQALGVAHKDLRASTSALVGALRRPQVRGRWGESTLRNVVEAAGMLKHVDFIEQPTIDGPEGRLRPDMIVRLPGGRRVVVDSKVPLDAFLDAHQTDDEEGRDEHLKRHAKQLVAHLQQLNSKAYWDGLRGSPELVFAFVPNDQVYLAAVDADPDLVRRTAADRVVVATPMTLIALLKLAAFGWRQEQVTQNTEEVLCAAREVHGRLLTFAQHLARHGRQLEGALGSWNKVVGSYESRLAPTASRIVALGAATTPATPTRPNPILESARVVQEPVAPPEDGVGVGKAPDRRAA